MDVFPLQPLRICLARQEFQYRFPDVVLVVIHLSRVDP